MAGSLAGTDTYFRTEARSRARTDYGIDHRTGEIWRWTDPLGPFSPWASGPWTAPPGDGVPLVGRLGEAAINRDGVSIEVAGFEDDPVSAIAAGRLAQLVAFWADWCGIPHGGWPVNPETGLTFVYWHSEFNGAKSCPGAVVRKLTAPLIRRVGDILRDGQDGQPASDPEPVPSPSQPPAGLELPDGVTLTDLTGWFGSAPSPDGSGRRFTFDPAGPLSRAWLERGRVTSVWPALAAVARDGDSVTFRFADGWTLRALPNGTVAEVAG